jgi:hypothetical protein
MEYLGSVVVLIITGIPFTIVLSREIRNFAGLPSRKSVDGHHNGLKGVRITINNLNEIVGNRYKIDIQKSVQVALGSQKIVLLRNEQNIALSLLTHTSKILNTYVSVRKVVTQNQDYYIDDGFLFKKYYRGDEQIAREYVGPMSTIRFWSKILYTAPTVISSGMKLRLTIKGPLSETDAFTNSNRAEGANNYNDSLYDRTRNKEIGWIHLGKHFALNLEKPLKMQMLERLLLLMHLRLLQHRLLF